MIKLKVLEILKEVGPCTSREIAEQTGWSQSFARAAVANCKKMRTEDGKKVIHICEWRRDEDGGRLYPRPVYALGHRKDAQRMQPLSEGEYRKRHYDKKRRLANIFVAAVPVDKRRLTTKKRPDVVARHAAARTE
jgi:hypothetical protein